MGHGMRGVTPLHCAVGSNATECVDVLLGADAAVDAVDSAGMTPLQTACMLPEGTGSDIVKRLLEANADPLHQDSHGRNALDIAKEYDRERTFWWRHAFRKVVEQMMRE